MNAIIKGKYGDKWLWGILFALLFFSIVEVYSASSTLAYKKHFLLPILGHFSYILLMLGLAFLIVKYRAKKSIINFHSYWIFPLAFLLLIYAAFLGGVEVNGAKRWLYIPFTHITFQPSEVLKVGQIFFVARMFRSYHSDTLISNFWKVIVYSFIPLLLIFRENLSTCLILVAYLGAMTYINIGFDKKLFFSKQMLTALTLIFLAVGVFFLLPTETQQKAFPRLATWANRTAADPSEEVKEEESFSLSEREKKKDDERFLINDKNSQKQYAKMAIGRGGFLGKFPGNSKARDLLPQAFSDFIYAIVIEEMGFIIGGILLPCLYLLLYFRLGYWAKRTDSAYYRNILMGFAILYLLQATMNFAVSVGFMPVTGQPLPFVSRGGTSLIVTGLMYAVLIAITKIIMEQEEKKAQEVGIENQQEKLLQQYGPERTTESNY